MFRLHPRAKKDYICAGTKFRGLAQGDSGGPIFIHTNGRAFVVGIASFTDAIIRENLTETSIQKDLIPG